MSRYLSSLLVTLLLYTLFFSLLFLNLKSSTPIEKEKRIHLSLSNIKIERVADKSKQIKAPKREKTRQKRRVKPKSHKVKPPHQPKKIVKKRTLQHKPKIQKRTPPVIVEQNTPSSLQPMVKSPKVKSPKVNLKAEYLKYNYQKIRTSIQELQYYPRRARKLHIEGEVKVKFLLKKDGSVEIKEIECKKRFLKKATRRTIERASNSFVKPPKDVMIHITLVYRLNL